MRTLKFRAWSVRHNIMLNSKTLHELLKVELDIKTNSTDNLLLMQFTGFVDFSGKEIYEGDILEYVGIFREGQRIRNLVEFNTECGGWYGKRTAQTIADILTEQHNDEWKRSLNYAIHENQRVFVIGNIYENPELMNSK